MLSKRVGIEIPLGTTVKTSFKLDRFRGSYSYSFFLDDRIDLAVSAGLFVAPIRFKFKATGLIEESVSENVTALMPVIGFRADFAITPKVFLKNRFDVFYNEIRIERLTVAPARKGTTNPPGP